MTTDAKPDAVAEAHGRPGERVGPSGEADAQTPIRPQSPIRLRIGLRPILISLSVAISLGIFAAVLWPDSPPLARALSLVGPLAFIALAVIQLRNPVAVIEPHRVVRSQRLFNKNVPIDGFADLRLAKRTLWRRSDDRLTINTSIVRRSDIRHLRDVLGHAGHE